MLVKLDEIRLNETVSREVALDRREVDAACGPVVLENLHANLQIRFHDPHYTVQTDVKSEASVACTLCGQDMTLDLAINERIRVQVGPPEGNYQLLDGGDMNIIFRPEGRLDCEQLVLETVDLALPDYPKHQEDDAACAADFGETDTLETTSPFQSLKGLLDK